MARAYYIHTFGCQMNESDSQRMGEALARAGWHPTAEADDADLILLNTCSIREKAEHKLYSELGRYRMVKARRGARIGVAGCVAQQEKEKLLQRAPYVDFVVGPDHLTQVPELATESGRVETDWISSEEYLFPQADPETSRGKATSFVTVMKGCDNVCSFCVVPYTRGREVSRPYAEVVREVAALVDVGVREVTLIGQNVNSYAGGCSFAELIRRVAAVPGLQRIRFTTSHPMDLSPELVRCFADVPQLMPHFHLPVQHGADTVLQRMRRKYTIAEYERRIGELFDACPHVALTSDIICGFPGETDGEHAQNVAFLERTPYDNLYSFLYSPRPHTGAVLKLEEWGEVPRPLALKRLEDVQALQMARTLDRHRARIGGEVEVLVEAVNGGERFGRSRENWTVHFTGGSRVGDVVRVHVTSATLVALRGAEVAIVDAAPAFDAPRRLRLSVVGT
jgi:tRNA-2-methylthio-N6-dimethylallyladenosine synthase